MFPCLLARINFVKCLITDKWRVKEVIFSNLNSLRQTRHFSLLLALVMRQHTVLKRMGCHYWTWQQLINWWNIKMKDECCCDSNLFVLYLDTLTSVCIFSIHFPRWCWWEFVEQSKLLELAIISYILMNLWMIQKYYHEEKWDAGDSQGLKG